MPIRQVLSSTDLPSLAGRVPQIDLLKGLAIIAVIMLHALPAATLFAVAAPLHLGQAVPVFAVLMGLNAHASNVRRGGQRLRQLYTRAYAIGRVERLYAPFLIIFAISLFAALARGEERPGFFAGLVTGELATSGPGNYFIGFAFQFALVAPALFVAYRRAPRVTAAAVVVASLALDVAASHVALFASRPYFYDASIIRFAPFVVAGMALADVLTAGARPPRWWLPAAVAAFAYLVAVSVDGELLPLATADWRPWGMTALAVPFAGLVVVIGLRFLRAGGAVAGIVAGLGRASYHIFLAQILWFALIETRSVAIMPFDVIACCAIGSAFWLVNERLATRSKAPAPAPAAA
jgi:peptidoglycan/LPS O-acetylase OafA/YrhL